MTTARKHALRTTTLLAAGAWAVAHVFTFLLPNVLEPWNAKAVDRLFVFRSNSEMFRPPYDSTVIHVDLNDRSLEKLGSFYPSRAQFGDVARALGTMGTAAQTWDFIFPAHSSDRLDDESFVRGVADAGNVYIGMAFVLGTAAGDTPEREIAPTHQAYLDSTSWRVRVEGNPADLLLGINPLINFIELSRATRGLGYLSLRFDGDGVFRRAPLVVRIGDAVYPSMPFRAVCDYLGVTPDRMVVRPGSSVTLLGARIPGEEPRDLAIPVNEHGEMVINFIGHWDRMKHIDFADVLQYAGSSDDLELLADELHTRGTLAVVSQVSTGSSDIAPVPTDNNYPLSGLHASVMHTILSGRFIDEWGAGRMLFVEAALLLILIFVGLVRSSKLLWVFALALIVGYFLAAALLFLSAGTILHIIRPSMMLVFGFVGISAYRFINEQKSKEALKRSFESYFPPSVVRRIMANPELIMVGGQKKELSIMFTDIKSFTSYSSAMDPDTIQRMLNEYFEAMVEIVFKYEGTVDKFIGDGLMVFFGDPEPQQDHALRCVRAGIDMQKKCRELKSAWEQKGLFPLKIRVGINTGDVIVGNMGSARRLSYTVLGSPVNLAQRLESNAPVEGIMISQRTWELVKDHVPTRVLEPIQPKGVAEPMAVYEVIVE
ncbi:MAG: adenylate/guanylate cyclase domain-containing protein [Bacteroidota bacterium]